MGVREEILDAIPAIRSRRGSEVFTPQDVVDELRRRGSKYGDSTIRTHVVSRMCRDAPVNHAVVYADLERVDRGEYRLAR
jgi:hypothetical protein